MEASGTAPESATFIPFRINDNKLIIIQELSYVKGYQNSDLIILHMPQASAAYKQTFINGIPAKSTSAAPAATIAPWCEDPSIIRSFIQFNIWFSYSCLPFSLFTSSMLSSDNELYLTLPDEIMHPTPDGYAKTIVIVCFSSLK